MRMWLGSKHITILENFTCFLIPVGKSWDMYVRDK